MKYLQIFNINKIKKHYSLIFFFLVLLSINIIFNFKIWHELISINNDQTYVSDGTITEVITEIGYQKILNRENPFSATNKVLYPFGINYSMNDPGTSSSIMFIFLRPFLSIHKSMLTVVLMNTLLSGIIMYLFLNKVTKNTHTSGLFSLIYTFMPFISHRLLGHFTYTPIYLFPLIALVIWQFIKSRSTKNKYFLSILLGGLITFSLYSNFYYFIMVWLALGFIVFIYALLNIKSLIHFIFENLKYILWVISIFMITILPWVYEARNYMLFEGRNQVDTLGSAIHYSADVIKFIIPNNYNPIYSRLFYFVSKLPRTNSLYNSFAHSWEKLVYPGIILIASYVYLAFNRQRITKTKQWQKIKPYFLSSIIFGILLLGPFLKIASRWSIDLDGVAVVVPMPFLIFHYLPFLNSLRVPSRFMPIATFFACVVGAGVMNYYLQNKSKKLQKVILIFVLGVFLLDQLYLLPRDISTDVPNQHYQVIKNDPENFQVLEIPFTVRDGFEYLGFVHALNPMQGMLVHKKPIMGGYLARVAPEVFEYYKNLNFLGYLLNITDKGNYNPLFEEPEEPNVYEFADESSFVKDELEFFGVKYILLKKNEAYTSVIEKLLVNAKTILIQEDEGYYLYKVNLDRGNNYTKIDFTKEVKSFHLGRGMEMAEDSYLMTDGKAMVFLQTQTNHNKLFIKASADENVVVDVYINKEFNKQLRLNSLQNEYTLDYEVSKQNSLLQVFFHIVEQETTNPKVRFYEISVV
jgi:hypothetical protein